MNVYTYVIATDSGAAPNFDPPLPTLAICKPRIRRGAEPGDLVLAFTGTRVGPEPHGVCWAGVVRGKQPIAEYWNDPKFQGKKPGGTPTPDNIYRPDGGSLVQVKNPSHGPESATRDIGGEFALSFEPAWYFGLAAPVLPGSFGLRMLRGRRGHRVVDMSDAKWQQLKKWLDREVAGVEVARPTNKNSSCGRKPAKRRC